MKRLILSSRIKKYVNIMGALTLKKTKRPLQVIHFVTSRCNARCKHCFYWKELNSKKYELSLDEIKKMSKNIGPISFLLIGGGEPFLRQDLPEIIKIYYDNSSVRSLSIPTNGSLTNKIVNDCRKILESCPKINFSLSISVDGLGKEHDESRQLPGCFDKLVDTFHQVSNLKKKYPNFGVSILSTITRKNQKKLKDIYEFVRDELKPDIFHLNYIRGNPKEASMKDIDPKYFQEINAMIEKDFNTKLGPYTLNYKSFKLWLRRRLNKIRYNLILETVKKNKYITPCFAGTYNVVIYENGDVYPCEMLNKKIGNIRDYNFNFQKLWKSKKADEIRHFIRDTNCFCTHECFVTTNILFNNKFIFRLLLNSG